jgi:hypothetical protein
LILLMLIPLCIWLSAIRGSCSRIAKHQLGLCRGPDAVLFALDVLATLVRT